MRDRRICCLFLCCASVVWRGWGIPPSTPPSCVTFRLKETVKRDFSLSLFAANSINPTPDASGRDMERSPHFLVFQTPIAHYQECCEGCCGKWKACHEFLCFHMEESCFFIYVNLNGLRAIYRRCLWHRWPIFYRRCLWHRWPICFQCQASQRKICRQCQWTAYSTCIRRTDILCGTLV